MITPSTRLLAVWLGLLSLPRLAAAAGPSTCPAAAGVPFVAVDGGPDAFPLAGPGGATPFVAAPEDAEVVRLALAAVAGDVGQITGHRPAVGSTRDPLPRVCVIAGTLGRSPAVDALAAAGRIDVGDVRGKWETFGMTVVPSPAPGVDRALVIAGSDRRGTAYGVFELSRLLGVSPWVWWADVAPAPRPAVSLAGGPFVSRPPAVRYRGIFLNDEDWGLRPWAAAHLDPDVKDIGPHTYAHVCELLLRLRANLLAPAMHECTKAFYHYPEDPATADRYGIVVTTSHAEPMLRDNVYEWPTFHPADGTPAGDWRFDTNRVHVDEYWHDRVVQSTPYESIYTVGMRGVHDKPMIGASSPRQKVALMTQIIADQRQMLTDVLRRPAADVPQILVPYKEVLNIYRAGLRPPPDVTVVWPDDNHGYIRQLSGPAERGWPGGSGVYYHLSYWGRPEDYLWVCSTSPQLVAFEVRKALATGADRYWLFNVGDIKPAEMETEFAMDLAWDPAAWPADGAYRYARHWAAESFGDGVADDVAAIQTEYFRLAQAGKPEHVWRVEYTRAEAEDRLRRYAAIAAKAVEVQQRLPGRVRDAYFQTILYPVAGAWRMNEKVLCAKLGRMDEATAAYAAIIELTRQYNASAGGKWDGMMDWHPRDQPAFSPAAVFAGDDGGPPLRADGSPTVIDVARPVAEGGGVARLPELGAADALTRSDAAGPELSPADAPWLAYRVPATAGVMRTVHVRCLPTHALHPGIGLRVALSVDGGPPKLCELDTSEYSVQWGENVLRGYTEATLDYADPGGATLRVGLVDPGVVVTGIRVD